MEETSVFVHENDSVLTLCARVMSGALVTEVVISAIYERRNAHGMYNGQSWIQGCVIEATPITTPT